MLTGTMIESRQDHVDLKGVTSHAVNVLLKFAYTGQYCLNIIKLEITSLHMYEK